MILIFERQSTVMLRLLIFLSSNEILFQDRVSNQREREKDVYLALGKRRRSSESPSPVKMRR